MTFEEWAAMPEDEPGELVDGRLEEQEEPGIETDDCGSATVAYGIASNVSALLPPEWSTQLTFWRPGRPDERDHSVDHSQLARRRQRQSIDIRFAEQ